MVPSSKFRTFNELLARGIQNFDNPETNITGLEEQALTGVSYQQLKNINRYMYTTYSTNIGDKVFSIEGVIPLNIFKKIEPLLLQEGYWYIAVNPLDRRVHGLNLISFNEFDKSLAHFTEVKRIPDEDIMRYRIPPWRRLCSENGYIYIENDILPIYTLPPREEFDIDNHPLNYSEILEYTDESLFRGIILW